MGVTCMYLYVRQERVKHTAAEQGPCGCDLYVRQERVKRTAAEQSPWGVTCM